MTNNNNNNNQNNVYSTEQIPSGTIFALVYGYGNQVIYFTEQIPDVTIRILVYGYENSVIHFTEKIPDVTLLSLVYGGKTEILSSENISTGKLEINNGINYEISIQQFSNGKFTNISTKTIKVPFNPFEKATVAVKTVDNGNGKVSVLVKFFDRKTGKEWKTSFTINKMSGVKGGIGLYTKNETLIDNVLIQYNKS